MKNNQDFHEHLKYIFILILAVVAIHGVGLRDHFVNWDDEMMIVGNPRIMHLSLSSVLHVFNSHTIFTDNFTEYYPVRDVSYMIDYFIWGSNPLGYHLSNIVFEIINAVLVFLLFLRLFKDKMLSLLAALIFAVHPLTAGVVSWISARKDLMAMTFYLIAFLYFVDFYRINAENERKTEQKGTGLVRSMLSQDKYLILSSIMFISALLSKASPLPFPGVLAAYMFIVEDERRLIKYISYLFLPVIIMTLYTLNLYSYSSYFGTGTLQQSYSPGWLFMFLPELFVIYSVKFLFPLNNAAVYIEPLNRSLLEPLFLISIPFIVFIIYLFLKYIKKDKILFFGFAWILLNMVPASNIISIQSKIAERFMYSALAGFGLIGARLFQINKERLKNIFIIILPAVLLSYGVITFMLNLTWYNGVTLWSREIQTRPYMPGIPETIWGYSMLGQAYGKEGDYEKDKYYSDYVLSIYPEYAPSLKELADVYVHNGDYKNAIEVYERVVKHDYMKSSDYIIIAQMYEKMKDYKNAIQAYEMAKKEPHPLYNDKGLDLRIKKLKDLIHEE